MIKEIKIFHKCILWIIFRSILSQQQDIVCVHYTVISLLYIIWTCSIVKSAWLQKRKGKIRPYKVNNQTTLLRLKRFYIKRFPIHSNACRTVLLCYQQSLSNVFFCIFYLNRIAKSIFMLILDVYMQCIQTQKFRSPLL